MLSCDRPRDQWIEDAHQNATREANLNTSCTQYLLGGLAPAIGECVQHNGENDQQHTAEQQHWTSLRRNKVIQQYSDDERQSDSDGERDRQARDVNGGHQKKVGYVENGSAEQG